MAKRIALSEESANSYKSLEHIYLKTTIYKKLAWLIAVLIIASLKGVGMHAYMHTILKLYGYTDKKIGMLILHALQ